MADRIGQQLGNYRLIRMLGQGGCAEVYLAEHQRLKTQAAIKVLYGRMNAQDIQNFTKEAQTIADLRHPHIISLFDFDVENGVPFLVMDYAPHGSLAEQHPLPTVLSFPVILSYLRQIGEALQFAHSQHFVHRDMKPENVLIGRQNQLLLSDFGVATMAYNSTSLRTQTIVGTTPYMAPEQILGKVCEASDQYALGIMVYGWLCGRLPFQGSAMEIIAQHLSAPPTPVRVYDPALSPHVEQVLLKVLAKEPMQRFATVSDFVTALEQAGSETAKGHFIQPFALPTIPTISPLTPTASILGSGTTREVSPESDQAYERLREQVQTNLSLPYYGAVVARAEEHQIGQVVHLVNEDAWLRGSVRGSGFRGEKLASVKRYTMENLSISAVVFTNILVSRNSEYMVWIDEKKAVPVSVPGGKVVLIDLR